jgi:hypothetical protein
VLCANIALLTPARSQVTRGVCYQGRCDEPSLKKIARSRRFLGSGGHADQFNRFVEFSG